MTNYTSALYIITTENGGNMRTVSTFILTILILTACSTVTDTLYLRQAKVDEPLTLPPVSITDSVESGTIYFSPHLSYDTKNLLEGDIQRSYRLYELDTTFNPAEKSLTWNIASVSAGFDMNIIAARNLAFALGMDYSSQTNFTSFGGNFGIGLYGYQNQSAIRFDIGLNVHSVKYDAYTVVERRESFWGGGTESSVYFFHDISNSTHIDPYINFTFNTAHKDWYLNYFINAGYAVQTLFAFEPETSYLIVNGINLIETDERGSSTAGFINVTPGIFFYLGEYNRLLLGTRFNYETQISGATDKLFIVPMLQFDFKL